MTQPIKFRGFRVDGKGWVEGFYFFNGTDHGIVHNTGFPGMWTAIHPSSLGMFTGLHDKNGKEIFGAIGEKGGDVVQSDWGYGFPRCIVFLDTFNYAKIECTISDNIEIIGNQWEVDNGK